MRGIMIGLALAVVALSAMTVIAPPARAQTRDESAAQCMQTDADTRIAGCTALINSGQETQDNVAVAYNNRGIGENKKGLYDQAIADSTQAIALKPDLGTAYAVRGSSYRLKGANNEAIADYNRALEMKATSDVLAIIHKDRGQAYENQEMYDAAIADFTVTIALRPEAHGGYNDRAWAYHLKGEDAKGLPDANKAIALAPKIADSFETRAEIHEKLGQRDKAAADYRAALKLDPGNEDSKTGLKRLRLAP